MENQHRKIKGYRELSQEEINLMNEIKAFGPQLEALVNKISAHLDNVYTKAYELENEEEQTAEFERLDNAESGTWIHEGKLSLQKGLMYLTRSVAQPEFF